MDPLVITAIVFAALCAVVVPLWLFLDRRRTRARQEEQRIEERDRLRRLVHGMRKHVTPEEVSDVQDTCRKHNLRFEDVGTEYGELDERLREAHRLAAKKHFESMCKGHQDPLLCMSKIIEHLQRAQRPYEWTQLGTTWTDLRELYRRSLLVRARKLNESMRRGDVCVADPLKEGEIEALLVLANATKDDLHPPTEGDTQQKA